MRVVLLMPSLSHRRLWASGSFARRQKSAMVVSSLKFRNSAICRSGSMPCWKLFTLPSESAGTTCLALIRVAAIALFYEQLVRISPALGTRVGYAAAVAEAEAPEAGLAVLDPIAPDAVSHYQPYWAVRAHLLQRLGKKREAADAYDRAIGLAEDPAVREFLLQKRG